jgi:hypothetical protein
MKTKLITVLLASTLAVASTSAMAWGYRGYHGGGWGGWVAPALIGGVVGYELAQPHMVLQPPVVYTQPAVITPPQPLYRKEIIYDQTCFCNKEVYVQVQ